MSSTLAVKTVEKATTTSRGFWRFSLKLKAGGASQAQAKRGGARVEPRRTEGSLVSETSPSSWKLPRLIGELCSHRKKKQKRISFGVSNHNIIRVTPNSQNTLFYISGKIASNSRQVYVFVFSSASDQSKNSPETLDLQCLFFPSLFKYISPLVSSQ